MRTTLATLPRWAKYLTLAALLADIYVATVTALVPADPPYGGLLGVFVALLGLQIWRDRDFDRLTKSDRLRVVTARRSGVSSGDGRLDTIARRQLGQAARSYRSDRILLPVLFTATLACPVIAALRRDDLWWLVLLVPMLLLLPSRFRRSDPRPRLSALEAAEGSAA